jgi:hypothetical protein
MYGSVPNKTQP